MTLETPHPDFHYLIDRNITKPELVDQLKRANLDFSGLKDVLAARVQVYNLGYSSFVTDDDIQLICQHFRQTKDVLVKECKQLGVKDDGTIAVLQRRLVLHYLERKYDQLMSDDSLEIVEAQPTPSSNIQHINFASLPATPPRTPEADSPKVVTPKTHSSKQFNASKPTSVSAPSISTKKEHLSVNNAVKRPFLPSLI